MTDKELEKKAQENADMYFKHPKVNSLEGHFKQGFKYGYQLGAKENQPTDEELLERLSKNGLIVLDKWYYPSKGEFPEEFKLVAVSIKGFDYTTTGLYIPKKDGSIFTQVVDKWLCQIPYHVGEYRSNEGIIAWQYLPEPQKEA